LITFESRSTGRTIRITSQGIITFYRENITKQEIKIKNKEIKTTNKP